MPTRSPPAALSARAPGRRWVPQSSTFSRCHPTSALAFTPPSPRPSPALSPPPSTQTEQDGKMSLNIFGKSDDVLRLLLAELGADPHPHHSPIPMPKLEADRALVPYDVIGNRLPEGSDAPLMWLDLRPGSRVSSAAHPPQLLTLPRPPPFTPSTTPPRPRPCRCSSPGHTTARARASRNSSTSAPRRARSLTASRCATSALAAGRW